MSDESATGLPPLEPGPVTEVLLSGRYRLGDELGSGPVGHVYAAHDVLLGRDVAVKVLDGLPDEVAVGRAVRAARVAARASSERLVEVLDVERGRPSFLVLQLARGRPLRAVQRPEPAAPERALALLDDVLDALSALHEVGAVHRDVGADNVWVDEAGRAWLTSAGLGEAARDPGLGLRLGPDAWQPGGTAPSPEQALGLPADARSDVYAAGRLGRDLLAGRARPAFAQVLRRATAEDPGERYAGAAELRAALASAANAPDRIAPVEAAAPPPAQVPSEQLIDVPAPPPAPPRRRGLLRRILPWGAALLAAWLLIGVPLLSEGVGRREGEGLLDALFGPVLTGRAAPPSPSPAPPAPPPPAQLPPDRLAAVLDAAAASPEDLGPQTADQLARLRQLDRLRGLSRAAEAADLYGLAALDAAAGTNSAPVAADIAELLRPELSPEGLVALVDRDPQATGPGGRVLATRLRLLAPLEGQQRRDEALELWLAVQGGRADGTLSPPFAAAATTVLEEIANPG